MEYEVHGWTVDYDDYEIAEGDSMWWAKQKNEEEMQLLLIHLRDLWWLAGLNKNPNRAKVRVLRYAENEGLLNEFKQSIAN